MSINTSNIDGQDHIVGEGAFTRCGIRLAHGTPYEIDVEPQDPCPVCFPDAKPAKKAKAEPVDSKKKSVGDKA
jgi:hypothetical protein